MGWKRWEWRRGGKGEDGSIDVEVGLDRGGLAKGGVKGDGQPLIGQKRVRSVDEHGGRRVGEVGKDGGKKGWRNGDHHVLSEEDELREPVESG